MAHILLVEDEIKLARFVELEPSYEGYQVSTTDDGRFSCTYGDKFYLSSKAASKRDLKFSKLVKPYP